MSAINIEITKLLLAKGADLHIQNKNGDIALMYAALSGKPEIVELLLKEGAKPNTQNKNGNTALIIAAAQKSQGHTKIVKLLIKGGADPNTKNNDGYTALFFAKNRGYATTVQLFDEIKFRNEAIAFDMTKEKKI